MTDAVAEAPFTDEQYEAEFKAQVDKREAEREATVVVPDPAAEVVVAPAAVVASVPAVVAPAATTTAAATPAPTAAAPAAKAGLAAEDEAILAAVPEGKQRDGLRARLTADADRVARNAKLEQDNRSMAGRVSAYQRRYEEASGKRPVAAPAAVTPEAKAEWAGFQTEFPEIAKAIEARFAAEGPKGSDAAATTQELVQYVQDQKRTAFLQDAWAAVDTVHPGWREKGVSKEFKAWKASSSTYEKLASSDDIADAIALFDLYGAHEARQAPAPVLNTTAADATAARRDAQIEGARSPDGRQASPNQQVDLNDPDQLFAFYASKANSRLKGRLH